MDSGRRFYSHSNLDTFFHAPLQLPELLTKLEQKVEAFLEMVIYLTCRFVMLWCQRRHWTPRVWTLPGGNKEETWRFSFFHGDWFKVPAPHSGPIGDKVTQPHKTKTNGGSIHTFSRA